MALLAVANQKSHGLYISSRDMIKHGSFGGAKGSFESAKREWWFPGRFQLQTSAKRHHAPANLGAVARLRPLHGERGGGRARQVLDWADVRGRSRGGMSAAAAGCCHCVRGVRPAPAPAPGLRGPGLVRAAAPRSRPAAARTGHWRVALGYHARGQPGRSRGRSVGRRERAGKGAPRGHRGMPWSGRCDIFCGQCKWQHLNSAVNNTWP